MRAGAKLGCVALQATAKALIYGGCTALTAEAIVDVKAEVDYKEYCHCSGWAYVCKNRICDWVYTPSEVSYKGLGTYATYYFQNECKAFVKDVTPYY